MSEKDYKKEFYEYGESLGIKIEDLQRLMMILKSHLSESPRLPKRILTEKEIKEEYGYYLTVGQLKKDIETYGISDDAHVMVQRVEDVYYNTHGWGVLLKKGEHYHNVLRMNENMREEIARRERGEEPEYPRIENPSNYICEDEKLLDEISEQYHPAWCVVGYKDKDFLFLDLHY